MHTAMDIAASMLADSRLAQLARRAKPEDEWVFEAW